MKKILLTAALAASLTTVANAVWFDSLFGSDTKGTVINHSNKASPATVFAKSYQKGINPSADFWQADNCNQADDKYQNTKDAIMVYNADVGIAATSKGLNCPLRAEADKTIFVGKSYFRLCTNAADPKTIQEAKTFGIASVILSPGIMADYNNNGLTLEGVPYGGSKNVLTAVIANEVDFGIIGTGVANPALEKGQIACPYTTDPTADNYIGKTLNLKFPNLNITKLVYTNSDNAELIQSLRNAATTNEFNAYLAKSGYGFVKADNFTDADVTEAKQWIDEVYNEYWK
jgi:hypothetical protein